MEIDAVIIGIVLFIVLFIGVMFIDDLYGEIKAMKRRLAAKADKPIVTGLTGAVNSVEKLGRATDHTAGRKEQLLEYHLAARDEEIKNLKAELNKVKFDYACEVAGKK